VTLVYRGKGIPPHVKYWIKPDLENRIKNGEIKAYFHSRRSKSRRTRWSSRRRWRETLKNDFVFAMTAIIPTSSFLRAWASASRAKTGCLSVTGDAGEQRARHLPGWCNRGRLTDQ